MNKVILIGKVVKDPEIRFTTGENPRLVAKFSLKVERHKSQGEGEADNFYCVAWDKLGTFVEKYLKQGTKIALVGHIKTGGYKNKENQWVYTFDVVAEEIYFAESKSQSTVDQQDFRKEPTPVSRDGFMSIPDGEDPEVPFN